MGGFGHSGLGGGGGGGIRGADRPSRNTGKAISAALTKQRPKPKFREVWPEIWTLVGPRRWLLAGCFLLMVVNRTCALVLPASFKPLIDLVFIHHRLHLLPWIVSAVLTATII